MRTMFLICGVWAALTLGGWATPIAVLATGDMHGYLEPATVEGQQLGGVAEMLAYWKHTEQYRADRFLVLGCGDTCTGPALATVFQNAPVLEVMNYMGYDACALGNHEFDYGAARLKTMRADAKFPFVTANVVTADGAPSDFAPYTMNTEQGVKIAVIGLTTTELAAIAQTGGLTTQPYVIALRAAVAQARAVGAETIIVTAHAPQAELVALAKQVADLRIPLMLGGHSHEFDQMKVGDTWVVNSGEWWRGYSRIDLDYNPKTGTTTVLSAKQVWLLQYTAATDPGVAEILGRWKKKMDADFNVVVAYTAAGLKRQPAIYNFVTDCWLAADAGSDFALTNDGGMRQDLATGAIKKSDIWAVMPFMNGLYRITLTGEQLLAYLPPAKFIGMAGLRRKGGQYLSMKTGQPLDPKATYRVVLNDYMYNTSATLKAADPNPAPFRLDWRQPVFDWLAAHPSSDAKPLETLIDAKSRVE